MFRTIVYLIFVMARFMRAIHAFNCTKRNEDGDDPDKPGHDG